jgi:sec-independent protein translocase protein TatC
MRKDMELTLFDHLKDLRKSLVGAAIALTVGTVISTIFANQGLAFLTTGLLGDNRPQTISPTEGFIVFFRVALLGGVTLSMPVIVFEIIRFILPGLLPNERRYLYLLLPGIFVCFAGGVAFAAFLMLPAAINFMQGFLATIIDNRWTLNNYVGFVTRVLFWMGVVFQTPLIIFFLAKMGVVSARQLGRFRKYAILVIAVVAALVTPTPDPVNMMIVMVPLYLLYETGIILARVATLGRRKAEANPS